MPNAPEPPKSTILITNTAKTEAVKVVEPPESDHAGPTTVGPGETRAFERPVGSYLTVENFAQDAFIRTINVLPKQVDTPLGSFLWIADGRWQFMNQNYATKSFNGTSLTLEAMGQGYDTVLPLVLHELVTIRLSAGQAASVPVTNIIGGTLTFDVTPVHDRVEDLGPAHHRLPNVDPVLCSYDPRGSYVDNIKNGMRHHVFEPLDNKSRGYHVNDGNLIVQNGVEFMTDNTSKAESHSSVVTTTHELTNTFSVGVDLTVGLPAKSVGGGLSIKYSELNSEIRSSTAGYTFAWSRTEGYTLTLDLDRLTLEASFKDDVAKASAAGSGCETALKANAKKIEDLRKEIKTISADSTLNDDAIARRVKILRDHIAEFRAERGRLVEALKTDAVGKFIDVWGTHYAQRMVFGKATYETRRFSRNELKKVHEWGLDVGVEAEGNIKGVDVGVDVNVSTTNREAFSEMVKDGRTRQTSVGGDGDDVEPIHADLVPLSGLIQKPLFGAAWQPGFGDFARRLDLASVALLGEPDLYPLLQSLEIWQIRFDGFKISQIPEVVKFHGKIKLNRSSHALQVEDPNGLDDPLADGRGYYIWNRRDVAGEAVSGNHDAFEDSGRSKEARTVYLIAERPQDNPKVTVSTGITSQREEPIKKDRTAYKSNYIDVDRLRTGASKLLDGELWVHDVLFKIDVAKLAFDDLPAYKRLEVSNLLGERMA